MDNFQAVERFDQAGGARIEKLFWIAASMEVSDLKDMLHEMDERDFKMNFPQLVKLNHYKECREDEELMQLLVDARLFGFLAEVLVPACDNFGYKNGKPVRWQVHSGVCRLIHIYAETQEELLSKIEKEQNKLFAQWVAKDKKKIKAKPSNGASQPKPNRSKKS